MRIVGNNSDLTECFEVVVDQDAEPADWDDALANFLLAVVGAETDQHQEEEN